MLLDMKQLLTIILCLFISVVCSQNIERTSVSGTIIVNSEDKEGVTVYNTSSNKGTVTDEDGKFQINVALNDVVEFGALQFQDFTITINEDILKTKQMTVVLVEEVNKLDEVVLLPYGLTGNLNGDITSVRTYNKSLDDVFYGLDHQEDFVFNQDFKSRVENPAFDDYNPTVTNMVDFVNIAGVLANALFSKKDKSPKNSKQFVEQTPISKALAKYKSEYINTYFNIPLQDVELFKVYVENQPYNSSILETDNRIQLLEHLSKLSVSYLKTAREQK